MAKVGEVVKGCAPGSVQDYRVAGIRHVKESTVRFQLPGHELTFVVSSKLAKFVGEQKGVFASLAGTATMYAECRVRRFGGDGRVMMQVPGKGNAANRPWGVCVILAMPALADILSEIPEDQTKGEGGTNGNPA